MDLSIDKWRSLLNDVLYSNRGRYSIAKNHNVPSQLARSLLLIAKSTPYELTLNTTKNYNKTYFTKENIDTKLVDKVQISNEITGQFNNLDEPLTIDEIINKFKVYESFDESKFALPPEITIESFDVTLKVAKYEKYINSNNREVIQKISETPIKKRNYLTKVKFHPKKAENISERDIELMFSNISIDKQSKKREQTNIDKKILLEPCIYDPHIGMLCTPKEDTSEYNSSIAKKTLYRLANQIEKQIEKYKPTDLLLTIGNDNMHIDNQANTTTRGTPQTIDLQYFPLFDLSFNIWINIITKLSRDNLRIHVKVISGNHDSVSARHLFRMLKIYFKNDKNIIFDEHDGDLDRQFFQFGNVGIALTHGKYEKNRLKSIMQAEKPKLWGETKYREVHVGHKHREEVVPFEGGLIRVIPTIAPDNRWHHRMGFVGNIRRAQTFVWDYNTGLQKIIYMR